MENKKIIAVILGLIVLGLLVFLGVSIATDDPEAGGDTVIVDDEDPDNVDVDIDTPEGSVTEVTLVDQEGNFEMVASYVGANAWDYAITGELPNPCYEFRHEAIVAESFPEQVSVVGTIEAPADDVICAQVIEQVSVDGSFGASPDAAIQFEVVRE